MWHFYNILDDNKAWSEDTEKEGFIENIGYALDLLEQGESLEYIAKVLKVSPQSLKDQIEQFKVQVSTHIPDTVELE